MIFPIFKWVNEGAEFDEIKTIIKQWYDANDKEIQGSDFVVNLVKLKKVIKSQTKKTLKDLKIIDISDKKLIISDLIIGGNGK